MSTLSEQHRVFTQQGRFERRMTKWSHQEYERYTVGTAGRGQSSGSPDARRAAYTNDRLEHQHENSQRFLGRDGQDGRMRGMRKPRR